MFKITGGKGFHMRFENGWTVSVQFGYGNYADNYNMDDYDFALRDIKAGSQGSSTAEIAAWDIDGTMLPFASDDTVKGWVSADEVAAFITMVRGLEKDHLKNKEK